jgi:hypothetical protein
LDEWLDRRVVLERSREGLEVVVLTPHHGVESTSEDLRRMIQQVLVKTAL